MPSCRYHSGQLMPRMARMKALGCSMNPVEGHKSLGRPYQLKDSAANVDCFTVLTTRPRLRIFLDVDNWAHMMPHLDEAEPPLRRNPRLLAQAEALLESPWPVRRSL